MYGEILIKNYSIICHFWLFHDDDNSMTNLMPNADFFHSRKFIYLFVCACLNSRQKIYFRESHKSENQLKKISNLIAMKPLKRNAYILCEKLTHPTAPYIFHLFQHIIFIFILSYVLKSNILCRSRVPLYICEKILFHVHRISTIFFEFIMYHMHENFFYIE